MGWVNLGLSVKRLLQHLRVQGQRVFMHPGEAYHGDLGMISRNDTFLAISNSGETDEVVKLIHLADNGLYYFFYWKSGVNACPGVRCTRQCVC